MPLMNAVLVSEPGGADRLMAGRYPMPEPNEEELLVRVHATALNRADLMQREGKYPPPPGASPLLGLEVAGVVEWKGQRCEAWNVGDRVFGLLPGGGYAEYAVLHRKMALPVPQSLTFEEAAAIPEVFLTAYQALFWYGNISAGERVLIHAGASGVGTAAIQLARVAGAQVFVTASARKHAICLGLGAELAIDYRSESFADRVLRHTDGLGADVILDFIGAPYFKENVRTMATDGRLVILAMMGGSSLSDLNLRDLFRKCATVFTSTLRNRSEAYKVHLTAAFEEFALPRFVTGALKPVIDRVYDWADVAEAHRRMEANENVGKIVLHVVSPDARNED